MILDVAIIIIATVKVVAAAAAKKRLSFLLRPFMSLPSANTMDKRILFHSWLERQKGINGLFLLLIILKFLQLQTP